VYDIPLCTEDIDPLMTQFDELIVKFKGKVGDTTQFVNGVPERVGVKV